MLAPFRRVWSRFRIRGRRRRATSIPVCMVAESCAPGAWRLWRADFGSSAALPDRPRRLFVAYYASAEMGCLLALGWPMPARVLDLFAEFRDRTNGLDAACGAACSARSPTRPRRHRRAEKTEMRDLVLRGGPWTAAERAAILDYCESDVEALARLLPAMLPQHRPAARPAARPLHGRRRRHGARRRADRRADAASCCASTGAASRTR